MKKLIVLIALVTFLGAGTAPVFAVNHTNAIELADGDEKPKKEKKSETKSDAKSEAKSKAKSEKKNSNSCEAKTPECCSKGKASRGDKKTDDK